MRLSAARTLVAVVVLVSSVAFVSSPLWSQDVDPQSLVGDWSGTWTITPDQGKESSDVYLLKIERVEREVCSPSSSRARWMVIG
jgi:hypothetical protein